MDFNCLDLNFRFTFTFNKLFKISKPQFSYPKIAVAIVAVRLLLRGSWLFSPLILDGSLIHRTSILESISDINFFPWPPSQSFTVLYFLLFRVCSPQTNFYQVLNLVFNWVGMDKVIQSKRNKTTQQIFMEYQLWTGSHPYAIGGIELSKWPLPLGSLLSNRETD